MLAFTIENSLGLYCKATDKVTLPMETADWERFGNEIAQSIVKLSPSESDPVDTMLKKTQPMNFYKPQLNKATRPIVQKCLRSNNAIGKLVRDGLYSIDPNPNTSTIRSEVEGARSISKMD